MAERRDYVALDWISGEIDETLKQACQALDAYVSDARDTAKLRFCIGYVNQVQGTLRMVEFHGAALFAHELDLLLQALLNESVSDLGQAIESSMAGLLYLPAYLHRVRAARKDLPAILLPRINDMRSIRNAELMSELAFFNPELSAMQPSIEPVLPLEQEEFTAQVEDIRQMFKLAFVGIVRNKQLRHNLPHLATICERLHGLSNGKPREPLWHVGEAIVEGLANQGIHPNAAVKTLLKEIDAELKNLQQQGIACFDQAPEPELMKTFLYYVARANSDTPLVNEIKTDYQLLSALDRSGDHQQLTVDADALRSVVDALLEELAAIKDYLDLHGRRNDDNMQEIQEAIPLLKRVGDTMAVLGLDAPLAKIRAQSDSLQKLAEQGDADPRETLLTIAEAIISVEQDLQSYAASAGVAAMLVADQPHLDDARGTVIRETRNGLERIKEAIIDFVASQWEHERLQPVPAMLHELSAGLSIAGLDRAASLLDACQLYSHAVVRDKQVPEWQMLDKLADAITAVDYYLERLVEDSRSENHELLDFAANSVAELGFPLASLDDFELILDSSADDVATLPAQASAEVVSVEQAKSHDPEALSEVPDCEPVLAVDPGVASTETRAHARPDFGVEAITEEPLDEEIAEIFVEEAAEVLETIQQNLPGWQANPGDEQALGEVRRAYHTLKGSGRMVGASLLGELAWSVENMLNRIVEHTLEPIPVHGLLVEKISAMVPAMVTRFEQRQPVNAAFVQHLIGIGEALADKQPVTAEDLAIVDEQWIAPEAAAPQAEMLAVAVEESAEEAAASEEMIAHEKTVESVEDVADTVESPEETQLAELAQEVASAEAEEASERVALLEIFNAEAEQHLNTMQEFIVEAAASDEPVYVSDALQRALHTLKGCARMANIDALVNIVTPLELLIKQLQAARVRIDDAILDVVRDSTRIAFIGLQVVKDGADCIDFSETDVLLERIRSIEEAYLPIRAEQGNGEGSYLQRVGEFMLESADSLASIEAILQGWAEHQRAADGDWFIVSDYAGRIAQNAEELELTPMVEVAQAWSQAALRLNESDPGVEVQVAFSAACSTLEAMLDRLAADQSFDELDAGLLNALAQLQIPAPEPVATNLPEVEEQLTAPTQPATDDIDADMVEMFLEEARDLLENIDETIAQWLEDRQRRACHELLQRLLHTLKGGARLSGLTSLGNLSHNFESFLTVVEEQGLPFDDVFFAHVQQYQDRIVALVEQVMSGEEVAPIAEELPENLILALKPVEMMDVPEQDEAAIETSRAVAQTAEVSQARTAQEAVKIPAQVIEQLVNLAGETSINRGRVEEQVSEVMFSLAELDATIERMQEQLRRLDIETEQQLIFRQEQVESLGLEEFDPLEMDRYSVLQQLSRSLQESSSDIREVKGSIFNKARDIETLLLQQSRINTDLQEGLMRSRMVPFSRMVPRLRRIIRQVSGELNKNVNLELRNIEGEMDRTILERMLPSFEHMLRNAVDHGIETEQERLAAKKPAAGNIRISLAREAGDVVIVLEDDGRGINLDAVRRKAIERGMMAADATLSDREVLQFILQAGFSTAQAVTQISGRGVGLDVVASEIKTIGGSVDIESTHGRGTRFVIRLPFTVSVNRALMVQTCGETYALPLNTIEGIVRVSPFELESYYQPDAPMFEYAGQAYKLRYMGALMRSKAMPDLENESMPLPVILVRSGEHSFAIQVDSLLGSREIVVKTLGPQFSSVQGLSGATVLGDGGVVVILDLHAMIRTDISQPALNELLEEEHDREHTEENRNLLVMVVDDSVTVRKVTSRFLERNGMDVLLAKDGVDAMQLLQDHKPDVMLLDIEMPRMDGFEVASRVKHSSKLKHLPIIMITSRTGEKHRLRAESIGVDKYLGKPYQELELLGNIRELTNADG
jgi:chemosensory pili system protein ChpA (sensor histidine kinase/response regulator)